ncbi:MAG TPA: bile acid:sodium symporter [Flavobacteriales bacterium]|nr:bile acid:sodium symporter [Flavobacteriales bacterium]
METNIITQIFLPLALFIIMMGMGLSLVIDDFRRVLRFPKAVAIGVILKLIAIPLITFGLLAVIPLEPELAVGFILLAACPGGATTNLITNLAKGDVALSITLTAIASLITVFTIPTLVSLGLEQYMGETRSIHLPFGKTMAQILAITVIPVIIGMVIKNRKPAFAQKAEKPVKIISAVFLVLIIAAALLKERANIGDFFEKAGPMALILNLIGMAIGYFVTLVLTRNKQQAVTVGVEVGVVNGTLGIAIAAGILGNSVMSIPSAIYSILMFPSVMLLIWLGTRNKV